MNGLSRDDLTSLLETPRKSGIRLYAHASLSYPNTQQEPIRLRGLLRKAEADLEETGMRLPEAAKLPVNL